MCFAIPPCHVPTGCICSAWSQELGTPTGREVSGELGSCTKEKFIRASTVPLPEKSLVIVGLVR